MTGYMILNGQSARVHSDSTLITAHDASGAQIARIENPTRSQRKAFFEASAAAVVIEVYRNRHVSADIRGVMGQRSGTVTNTQKWVRNVNGDWYCEQSRQKMRFY